MMQPAKVDSQRHTVLEELDERVLQVAVFDCAGQIWPSNRDSMDRQQMGYLELARREDNPHTPDVLKEAVHVGIVAAE